MHIELEDLSREELIERLNMNMRLFDVAYRALLSIASPGNPRDLQQDAARAVAVIERYPNDPEFSAGYKVTSQSDASCSAFRRGVDYCESGKMG